MRDARQIQADIGQHSYTWTTEKGWANTCRRLAVVLNDGTTLVSSALSGASECKFEIRI